MRNSPHLHERHLMEAVQRKIITSEQMESVMALSRTLSASGDGSPDLGWISAVHGAAATMAVLAPMFYLMTQADHFVGMEVLLLSFACALGSFGLARASRRWAFGPVPESIFTAGTALFAFGIGAGLFDVFVAGSLGHSLYDYETGANIRQIPRWQDFLAGDLAMVAAAVGLWRATRAAPVGVPLALGLMHGMFMLVELGRGAMSGATIRLSEGEAALWVILFGALMLGLAKLLESRSRSLSPSLGSSDLAFWVMSLPVFPMGLAAVIRIDREAWEAFPWLVLGLLVGALGLKSNRRSLLGAGALSVVVFPAYGLEEAHAGNNLAVAVLVLSVVCVALAAASLRRYYVQRWMRSPELGDETSSVWM